MEYWNDERLIKWENMYMFRSHITKGNRVKIRSIAWILHEPVGKINEIKSTIILFPNWVFYFTFQFVIIC
jgi:hypothetical protein